MIESSLKTMGKVCCGKGKTITEAILDLKPEVPRGIGILVIKNKDKVIEKILQPNIVRDLFGKVSRLQKQNVIRNVKNLFGVIE